MPVQTEDHAAYSAFAENMVKKLGFHDVNEKVVWHYTTGDGLLGILKTGQIFSTQLACLNDQTELNYGIDLFRSTLLNLRNERPELRDADTELIFRHAEESALLDVVPESPFYVACFSRHDDDLSQWRAYGSGENGYAIGFYTEHLKLPNLIFGKVNYLRELHEQLMREIAVEFINFFKAGIVNRRSLTTEIWLSEFLPAWEVALGRVSPMMKHQAFRQEKEFRCIRRFKRYEGNLVELRQKGTLLARHLPLGFRSPNPAGVRKLPISHVIVGPCRHPKVSKASVEALLRKEGYGDQVAVCDSRVPFQIT